MRGSAPAPDVPGHDAVFVSVVVPVLDREREIGPCVDSLLASSYPAVLREIIVVDNGSRDGTLRVLEGYGDAVRLERATRRGPSAARNAGVRVARGQIIAFTDSDCVVDPGWLSALARGFADEAMGAVGGRVRATPEGNDIEHFGERVHDHAKAIHYFRPAYLITMNCACRADLLRSLGGFDERLLRYEDVDLAYRLQKAGVPIAYVDDATVFHRCRNSLASLAAEGFVHGYYSAQFRPLHPEFVRAQQGSALNELPLEARTDFTRPLSATQEAAFRALFSTSKRVGRAMGKLFAPKLSPR